MRKLSPHRRDAGFSIIELLIVLVILGIIVTFAVIALGNTSKVLERKEVATAFKVGLERSRYDAVKRRPGTCADMSRVEITSATSFTYITDLNQNGTLEPASESRVIDYTGRNIEIVDTPAPTYPIVIRFDERGNTSSGACGSETVADTPVTFCEMPCGTPNGENATAVYVSPTGTVAVLLGGESAPTFTAPTLQSVASGFGINEFLAVWTGTPPSPTPWGGGGPVMTPIPSPSPTITPTPSPTETPVDPPPVTPTPTPTPTPTVTPTPTPTPRACDRNERPGNPPTCDCLPPFFVQGNGQCK